MTTKAKVGIAAVALLTAFAFGRFTTPVKIKTEIKTVEVEKKTDNIKQDKDLHKETTTTTVKNKDGSEETKTTVIEDTKTDTSRKDSDSVATSTTQTKEVTRGSSPVTISLLAGASLTQGLGPSTLVWGGAITHPVLGPITIGLWGLTSKEFGASLGLTF
jgi:hypothetical protein